MDSCNDVEGPRQGSMPPTDAVGQVSFSPATQTTVVKTTTTTTVSFPPFVLNAPKDLADRDPEIFPLAAIPTPPCLKKLRFPVGSRIAQFEELDDAHQALRQHRDEQATLRLQNGSVQSATSTYDDGGPGPKFAQPWKPRTQKSQKELEDLRKQSVTPISMSDEDQRSDPDAVELDSFHRRHAHQPLRPTSRDKSAANVRSNGRGDQAALAGGASQNGKARLQPAPSLLKTHPSHSTSRRSSESRSISTSAAPKPIFNERATCSSTPPHDGSEASSDPEIDEAPTRPRALGSIDTASAQDASLPSPSLSPITAAAHVGRSNSVSRLRGAAPPNLGELGHRKESSDHGVSQVHPRSDREKSALLSPELMDAERKAPTPAIKDIPHLLNTFDYMPENMQQYIMYQLLRRSSKTTLHFVAEAIAPALKVDFFKRLPPELRENIVGCLDVQSMCRAAQVSKLWRHVIDRDEKAWMRLISANNLNVPNGEVGRAIKEGWGWQFPRPNREWEFDLTKTRRMRNGTASALDRRGSHLNPVDLDAVDQIGTKRKRAAPSKPSESNKRLRRHDRPIGYEAAESINDSAHGRGPNAYAKLAEATIPDPRIGVKGLRQMALHKSIYRRHHRMRASWLDPEAKPKHIAFRAHEGHVITCLQFDSEKILTGSDDAIIDIYDTATGAQRRRLTGHEGGVWALEYQDNILVSGSTDRSVRIWDMNNGKCLHIFQGHTSTVRCLQILQPTEAGRRADGSSIMLPRERLIITGSRDSSCRIWKLPKPNDRSVYQTNPAAAEDNPFFQRALTGHTHSVRAIAAHSDVLVSGSYDNTVKVWQISTGDTMHTLRGHSTKVYSVVLDHERKRCISGSMDTIVKVWSIETGECLFNLNGHSSLVGLLDLKDNVLVSAAADWTLKIWDPEHGRNIHTLKAHSSAITCFAHDGYKVVSGSEKTLKMWSTQTGLEVRDLLTDLRGVWQVRFDERRCIAAVHRGDWTYIEVLDFGAAADGVSEKDRGRRIVVDAEGKERSLSDEEAEFEESVADEGPDVVEIDE